MISNTYLYFHAQEVIYVCFNFYVVESEENTKIS